jgi:cell cycle serine/threonine-protein kinase CDC5/MSD2
MVIRGGRHFDYITARRQGAVYVRKSHTVSAYPEDLKTKVYLLKHFEQYIMDRLYGDYEYTFEDVGRTRGMEWVQKYLRMKHVIVFKMSHDVLQVSSSEVETEAETNGLRHSSTSTIIRS